MRNVKPMLLHKNDIEQLYATIDMVMKEPSRPFTISDMADYAAMSETKFKKAFTQLFAAPVFIYITSLKLQKAKDLLTEGDLPIRYIAKQVGYRYSGNFTKAFKKHFGTTPHKLRQ